MIKKPLINSFLIISNGFYLGWAADAVIEQLGSCCVLGNRRNLGKKPLFSQDTTALAWNVPDVALLMAVAFGNFLRTVEALTLQRYQWTVHPSRVLITLPSTKTCKRTGETQSFIIDDGVLVSIINRLLYIIAPTKFLLVRLMSFVCQLPCSHRSFDIFLWFYLKTSFFCSWGNQCSLSVSAMPVVGSVEECEFEGLRVSRSCLDSAVAKFCCAALLALADRCREHRGCMVLMF